MGYELGRILGLSVFLLWLWLIKKEEDAEIEHAQCVARRLGCGNWICESVGFRPLEVMDNFRVQEQAVLITVRNYDTQQRVDVLFGRSHSDHDPALLIRPGYTCSFSYWGPMAVMCGFDRSEPSSYVHLEPVSNLT